ncbi:jg385, partial [Pararge aegeria aegeria]
MMLEKSYLQSFLLFSVESAFLLNISAITSNSFARYHLRLNHHLPPGELAMNLQGRS